MNWVIPRTDISLVYWQFLALCITFWHIYRVSQKKLKVWIFSTTPGPPPPLKCGNTFWGKKIVSNYPLKMAFQPTKTGWNRMKFLNKNTIGQKSVEIGPKTPHPPLKIHTFIKVWIWGWPPPPQCGKNPHFLFFFFWRLPLIEIYFTQGWVFFNHPLNSQKFYFSMI